MKFMKIEKTPPLLRSAQQKMLSEMHMKIYISGPISGRPYLDALDDFATAEKKLQKRYPNATIVNPMTIYHKHNSTYLDFMISDLRALQSCSHIHFFTFLKSPGMKIESIFAKKFNIKKI